MLASKSCTTLAKLISNLESNLPAVHHHHSSLLASYKALLRRKRRAWERRSSEELCQLSADKPSDVLRKYCKREDAAQGSSLMLGMNSAAYWPRRRRQHLQPPPS